MVVRDVSQTIVQLRGNHSVLLAKQNINMPLGVADYVYVISKGAVVYESKPEELRNDHEIKSKYLGV